MSGPGRGKTTYFRAAAELTWAVYLGLTAVLVLALVRLPDRLATLRLFFAAVGTPPRSISQCPPDRRRLVSGTHSRLRGRGGLNALLGGDIDGALLLFYLPGLAVLMPVFVLPPVIVVWRMKTQRQLSKARAH